MTGPSLCAVRLVFAVTGVVGPLRLFRNGYQSWSPSAVATLGLDRDPSEAGGVPRLVRSTHHADEEPVAPGELRSEMVTVLADGGPVRVLVGFEGGHRHDGTLRLHDGDGEGRAELAAEAFLGGATLAPGEERSLHPVVVASGADRGPLLEAWAAAYGTVENARIDGHYQVGWCSWYHYFGYVTEGDLRANLAHAADWPFEVFQLDDGYQPAIGDWLGTNGKFSSDLDELADAIAAAGRRPGIWIAPFLARPDAIVATANPGWIARYRDGVAPLVGMWHPVWGGETLTLDTSHPEVLDHLERVARALVGAGFTYLKLDFTYAPAADGVYHDPTMTPAQRVRAGYDAVRRGPARMRSSSGAERRSGRWSAWSTACASGPTWRRGGTCRRASTFPAPTPAANRPRPTPSPTRSPGPSCTGACGSTIPTASCCAGPTPGWRPTPCGPGPTPWACAAAWPSCPTTWACSTATPGPSSTRFWSWDEPPTPPPSPARRPGAATCSTPPVPAGCRPPASS